MSEQSPIDPPHSPSRLARVAFALLAPLVAIALVAALFEVGLRLTGHVAIYEMYSKPSLFWRYDELLGWSHEPGASGEFVGPRPWPIEFRGKVSINSLGLRGPEIPPRESSDPRELRVLFSGDSIVAALEVDHEQTFVALLEPMLRERLGVPVRTINAGVRGYGTDQDYLYFRDRGWRLEPDLVVFFHSGNDPGDNTTLHEMRRPFGKPAFSLRDGGKLELVGAPVPHYPSCSEVSLTQDYEAMRVDRATGRMLCAAQMLLFDHSALFSYLTLSIPWNYQLLRNLYYVGNPHNDLLLRAVKTDAVDFAGRLTTEIILAYAEDVRRRGIGFLVSTHVGMGNVDSDAIARAGVSVLDLSAELGATDLRWHHDGHFNPKGHQLVAELLVDEIASHLRARAAASSSRP
jgi:lysophospholipase L1-like esterase